ncbi:gamma-butyrobetaine hydroxylase-like domain-containing protein [Atopomonas sediminilitoris]|uniref:gamma-butyrobetaine hydroxylase-like domain-containing protein n=1 Tax=Atopomonas sediminilitoris TaxID=2919919 RepID=UPI001F4D35B1|nr:DUF971 domain-containing protein [Atopomonas sediminilitoris]MCJ8170408.1 DUF971 domain-containing protein [Atopomonas sediminilitoris]
MPLPSRIKLHKASRELELIYNGNSYRLSAEYLRVHSPSAEVRGHGRPILQVGKQHVALLTVEPAGQYALKLTFDDGHDSGLYSWDYLYQLATQFDERWALYLEQLRAAKASRDPHTTIVRL